MANDGTDAKDSSVNPQRDEWLALLNELETYEVPKKSVLRPSQPPAPAPAAAAPAAAEPANGSRRDPPAPAPPPDESKAIALAAEKVEGAARAPEAEVRRRLSKYDELRKKPSMTMKVEDLKVWDELSEIMGSVNRAVALIDSFKRDNAEKLPVEKFDGVAAGLKEVSSIMFREFHALRHGKQHKTYDKKNVCTKCHSVFMAPLPDGICDECRSNTKPHPRAGEY